MIHKLTQVTQSGTQTIFPATVSDAVVYPGNGTTGMILTDLVHEYNVSVLYPSQGNYAPPGDTSGNRLYYNLPTAISVLADDLSNTQKVPGTIISFYSEPVEGEGALTLKRYQWNPGYRIYSSSNAATDFVNTALWIELPDDYDVITKISPLVTSIATPIEMSSSQTISGYVGLNGEIISNSGSIHVYQVEEGEFYSFSLEYLSTNTSIFPVNWYNSSDAFLGHTKHKGVNSPSGSGHWENVVIQAPKDATSLYISGGSNIKICHLVLTNLSEIFTSDAGFERITSFTINDNQFININGELKVYDPDNPSSVANQVQIWAYPVEEGKRYAFSGYISRTWWLYFVYWIDVNGNIIGHAPYGSPTGEGARYTDQIVVAPEGAVQLYLNVLKSYSQYSAVKNVVEPHIIYSKDLENKIFDLEAKDEELAEVVSEYEFSLMEPDRTSEGMVRLDGTIAESSSYIKLWIYSVTSGEQYAFSGAYSPSINPDFVSWFDENNNFISRSGYTGAPGSSGQEVIHIDTLVTAPDNAAYLYLNVQKGRDSSFAVKSVDGRNYIYSKDLKDSIEKLQEDVKISSGATGIVHIYDLDPFNGARMFTLRVPYNDEKDIILDYRTYPGGIYTQSAGQINPSYIYLGPKDKTEQELLTPTYMLGNISDSTHAFSTYEYWAIFQQHGYCISTVNNDPQDSEGTSLGSPWDDTKVGAWVIDQLGRHYTVGHVTNTTNDKRIYLLPAVKLNQETGHIERDVRQPRDETEIVWLQVEDPSGDSTKYYFNVTPPANRAEKFQQIGPVVKVSDRKFVIDGKEITEPGIYSYKEFSVSETRNGYDPATIGYDLQTGKCDPSYWFSDPYTGPNLDSGAELLARFKYSFNFVGAQCSVNASIEVLREIKITGGWGATCQIGLFDRTIDEKTYKAYYFLPKTVDWSSPFRCSGVSGETPEIRIYRTQSDLTDLDIIPERFVSYLKTDEDEYLIGMSAGLSRVNGITTNSQLIKQFDILDSRPAYGTPNYNYDYLIHLSGVSSSTGMKFYVHPARSRVEDDYYMLPGYCREINYYVSYFDPALNRQQCNYWYKDGESYIIYLHCFTSKTNAAVDLPEIMEGLSLKVVEKTDGATLESDKVINGKIYVSYTNGANYLVLKTVQDLNVEETNKIYDLEEEVDELSSNFDGESPVNDPNILKYLVDEENRVFAEIWNDGTINTLVPTEHEKEVDSRLDSLEEFNDLVSSPSIYNDPDVAKYIVDEENKVLAEIKSDGQFKVYAKSKEEKEMEETVSRVSDESPYNDPNVLKYIVDDDDNCLGYIALDGTVHFYKAEIHNSSSKTSDTELLTVVGLLANSSDNVKLSNNKKMLNTIFNISTPKPVVINSENQNNINLTPKLSIIDDDTIDGQIPSSRGLDWDQAYDSKRGGYFSLLLPIMLSLSDKYGKDLPVGLACEGHRVGFTPINSDSDDYTELNGNGEAVKWVHDNMGWNVFNHSMTAQLPMNAFHVSDINSSEATRIRTNGTFNGLRSFYNTVVLDDSTGKWYEVNSNLTEWVERTPFDKYAMPFYYDWDENIPGYKGDIWFNRNFDFDYSWGEWFKRADRLGLPYERVIVHNGSTSSVYMCSGGRKYADWSIKTDGIHNYPPLSAMVNRISGVTGSTNVASSSYKTKLISEIDNCRNKNTWMVLMSHFDSETHRNYYMSGYDYGAAKDPNYPERWITPLDRGDILDIISGNRDIYDPPQGLNLSGHWRNWHPAPGTQAYTYYEILDYALSHGVEIVAPMDGWLSHGNILNIGVDRGNQTYPFDAASNKVPYTDEELSYLTVGADLSIRYFNNKIK